MVPFRSCPVMAAVRRPNNDAIDPLEISVRQ